MSGIFTHKFGVVFKDNEPIGYTVTTREADDICKKFPEYEWGTTKTEPTLLPLLVVNCFSSNSQ